MLEFRHDRSLASRGAGSTITGQAQRLPPGRKPDTFYKLSVGAALLRLNDRAALECNALAQLPVLVRLADERYPGKIWRRGLCLRDLLTAAVDEVLEAADGEDLAVLRMVLGRATKGETLTAIARALSMRRESLSRGLWHQICALVWERLKARLVALEHSAG